MKRLSLILLLATLMISAYAQQVTLSISNPSDYQRQEVVETDLNAVYNLLGMTIDEPFIIKNGFGQEQTYQKTYDGKLLMYIAIQPHSKATFTITKGQPSPSKSFVFGKIYPERADDLTWENDRGYGLDCYAAGQSLGCGAPALLKDEQLLFPYCWQKCYILDNGPLRFTAELTYGTNSDGITEHRIVTTCFMPTLQRIRMCTSLRFT